VALSAVEIATYQTDGVLFPKRVLLNEEAEAALAELEAYERRVGEAVNGKWRYKSHLVFPWINRIMRLPRILDLVVPLLGPDLMVWTSHLYPKEAGDGRFISWHQDAAHWGLDSQQIVTVWIALTPVTRENGCMRMLPKSHRRGIVEHEDTWDPANILTRGQTITDGIDEEQSVSVELHVGECSFHHVNMFHASHPNNSDGRRVGLALRYMTPSARQQRVDHDFATLVRGEDRFGHFELEPQPEMEMDPEFVALHERISDVQAKIYLSGTDRAGVEGLTETSELSAR
jgi:non-haem Fe2+, alpha-ketoglutarate-dependent halogenase